MCFCCLGLGMFMFFAVWAGGHIFLFTLCFAPVKFSGVCAGCLKRAWTQEDTKKTRGYAPQLAPNRTSVRTGYGKIWPSEWVRGVGVGV